MDDSRSVKEHGRRIESERLADNSIKVRKRRDSVVVEIVLSASKSDFVTKFLLFHGMLCDNVQHLAHATRGSLMASDYERAAQAQIRRRCEVEVSALPQVGNELVLGHPIATLLAVRFQMCFHCVQH